MGAPSFTCEAKVIAGALRAVRDVVERANTIPILANVLIEADAAGTVRVTCSNLDIMATRIVVAEVATAGAITVPALRFTDVVAAMEDGAQVQCDVTSGQMHVKSGRSRFRFSTLPASDFPKMIFEGTGTLIELPGRTLGEALDAVRPAISSEELRYYLCGVFLHIREGMLRFAATDGHRLARIVIPAPEGTEALPDTIVGTPIIDLIRKNIPDGYGPVRLEVVGSMVRFAAGDLVITGKTVEGTYPDYARTIPGQPAHRIDVDRDSLARALKRVLLANDDKVRAVKLTITPGSISISSASPSIDGSEEVPCQAKLGVEDYVIGYNGRYLSDLLGVLDVDTISFGADSDPRGPTLITSASRPDATFVLMPMRV